MNIEIKDFFDIDLSFKPTLSKDIGSLKGNQAIIAGIKNAIYVSPLEKPFDLGWGLGAKDQLFEHDIEDVILYFSKRIENFLHHQEKRILKSKVKFEEQIGRNLIFNIFFARKDSQTIGVFKYFLEVVKS